ncbi:lipoprotein [Dyadobacter fermentans DSM 18053]|uniref:Lipoprotein n=2 Tax=Dyadobacter fermentans TaxID=94254 RepID=C6VUW6_DYAFD|nr:lipoprotein [Dyadobacter fermentans DSM 18053]
MQKLYISLLLVFLCAAGVKAQYITIWKTDNPGSSTDHQILIPATGTNYSITWQEVGNLANSGAETASGYHTLTFPNPGIYEVSISPGSGTFTKIQFDSQNDNAKLLEIKQWGDIQWENMDRAYSRCTNMRITASDIPNLQNVTSTYGMFSYCSSITTIPGINSWDVSSVTEMDGMFGFTSWNEPINNWDVSNVIYMGGMFHGSQFNQPIGNWDVSKVTDMSSMFAEAKDFNQPLNTWDVSSVTNMYSMFNAATSFNQPLDNWNVSQVTNTIQMFERASAFNGTIGSWNTGNVWEMSRMFKEATSFNQSLDNWDVGQVTDMAEMFYGASAFNGAIGSWNVGNVQIMHAMFGDASSFNQPINNWDVSQVEDMSLMFSNATAFNQPLSNWSLANSPNMFETLAFTGIDCVNMSLTLEGWAANPNTSDNILMGAQGVDYGTSAAQALETLQNAKGWMIEIGEEVECAALEVSLISFDAKSSNGIIRLEWSTASETDNDYFEVERLDRSRKWVPIGRVKGAGTATSVQKYLLDDLDPMDGTAYYRLKIVDFNGKTDYSSIQAITLKTGSVIHIFPNPTSDFITISGKDNGYLRIFNTSGKQMAQVKKTSETILIPVNELPIGIYMIKSDSGWFSKFVKE